jgi:hypothetical protein
VQLAKSMQCDITRRKIKDGFRASLGQGESKLNVEEMRDLSLQEMRIAIGNEHEELRQSVHSSKGDLDVFVAELQSMVPDLNPEEILLIRTDPSYLDLALNVIARETLDYVVDQRMLYDIEHAEPISMTAQESIMKGAKNLWSQYNYNIPDLTALDKMPDMQSVFKSIKSGEMNQLIATFFAENAAMMTSFWDLILKNMANEYTSGMDEHAAAQALQSAEWLEKREKMVTMSRLLLERPESLQALFSKLEFGPHDEGIEQAGPFTDVMEEDVD